MIGGKIEIEKGEDAGEYYEICVVRIGQNNRMYLHEVDIEKTDSVPFNYAKDFSPDISGYDYPSINSIFEKLREVNRSVEKSEGISEGDLEPDTSESNEVDSASGDSVRLQLEDVDVYKRQDQRSKGKSNHRTGKRGMRDCEYSFYR